MRSFLMLATLLFLSGCITDKDGKGVSFGSGEDDYKESPCACIEIQQRYKRFYRG
jgi:hypothetical protein